jgi:ADP-ribose pyrophosphatase YjhB (NUDIX family)/ribosomal protein S18 acetylase RimI-like enzyme
VRTGPESWLDDPALRHDVGRLIIGAVESGAALGWLEPPSSAELGDLLDDVRDGLATGRASAAIEVIDGQVAGFGYWRRHPRPTYAPHADLERLLVDPAHRRRGLGRALLRDLVRSATAAGVEVLTLDVRGGNLAALALYRREGFAEYGRLPDFVAVGPDRWDKVLLARRLDREPPVPVHRTDHLVAWVVLQRADGRVLVARRAGVGYADGRWGLPGGHVEDAESLPAAAARELLEEVAVRVEEADLEPLGVTRYVDDDARGIDVFFRAHRWSGEPRPASECDAVTWCEPEMLTAPSLPWLGRALREHLIDGRWLRDHPLTQQRVP